MLNLPKDLPGHGTTCFDAESCGNDRTTILKKLSALDEDAVISCKDNLEFMGMLSDGKFKLIVTSPPYNLGKSYEDKLTLDEYLSKQKKVIDECVRMADSQGSICWQVGNYVHNSEIVPLDLLLYPLFLKHGLKLKNRIIWCFGHGLHCTKRLSGRYETINWWTKSDDYTCYLDPVRIPQKYGNKRYFRGPNTRKLSCNPKGNNPSDVWEFPNVKSNYPEKNHPPFVVSSRACR